MGGDVGKLEGGVCYLFTEYYYFGILLETKSITEV